PSRAAADANPGNLSNKELQDLKDTAARRARTSRLSPTGQPRAPKAANQISVQIPTLEGPVSVSLPGNEPIILDDLIPRAVRAMTGAQQESMTKYLAQIPNETLV